MNRTLRRLRDRSIRRFTPSRPREVSSIDAIVPSAGFDDFLSITLPWNRDQLDRILVITTPADEATQQVCFECGVECIATDEFHRAGATFNKGRGLNVGLRRIGGADWILVLDADIALPSDFRAGLSRSELDAETLYGARRLCCTEREDWDRVREGRISWSDLPSLPTPYRHDVFLPLGFFQLFHASCRVFRRRPYYPVEFRNARKVDTMFAKRWRRRSLLSLDVVHLGPVAENHFGRVTPRPWGAVSPEVGSLGA